MSVKRKILGYEATDEDLERTELIQEEKKRDEIIDLPERTYVTVNACYYSRVDKRMKRTGYYVSEIYIMPGLGPHSFLPEVCRSYPCSRI